MGDKQNPLYLTTTNTTSEERAYNGLKITELKAAMAESPAGKRILILDCCYSGRGIEGAMGGPGEEIKAAIELKGTYSIAAVPRDHKALAPEGAQLTKFTGTLVSILERGIAVDADVLTISDLFGALKKHIGGSPAFQVGSRRSNRPAMR